LNYWDSFEPQVKDMLRDSRQGPVNPKRLVVLKSLYSKNKIDQKGLSLQEIKKILFDLPTSAYRGYFNPKKISNQKSDNLYLEALIQKQEEKYLLDKDFANRFTQNRIREIGTSIDTLVKLADFREKEIISNLPQESKYDQIKTETEKSIQIIAKNYAEFFEKMSDNDMSQLTRSLQEKDPYLFDKAKQIGSFFTMDVGEYYRLALDMWGYTFYDILFANHLKDRLELDFNLDNSIIKNTAEIILESQDANGSWSMGKYEKSGFDVIDTAIIIELLYFLKLDFPSISIPKNSIEKAQEFLKNSLKTDEKNSEMKLSSVEHSFMRQNTLLSTGCASQGMWKTNLMLKKSRSKTLHDKDLAGTLRYLLSLRKGGAFSKEKNSEVDLESTTLITKMIFGRYNLNLTPKEINEISGTEIDPLDTVEFIQDRRSLVSDYLAQGHANVFADTLHALLTCGVWPSSYYVVNRLATVTKKAVETLQKAKEKNFWSWFEGKNWIPFSYYPRVMPAIHVQHEALNCLEIIHDYKENPNSYWNRLSEMLQYT